MSRPLLIGRDNRIENASLSANPAPATTIDWLLNEDRAQRARWVNPAEPIIITAAFESPGIIDYAAIAGHNFPAGTQLRFELLDTDDAVIADTGFAPIGAMIPAGAFVAGIDPWAGRPLVGDTLIALFTDRPLAASLRLSVDHGYNAVAPEDPPPVQVSDGIYRQDASGIVSMECENGVMVPAGTDSFDVVADGAASGGQARYKSGSEFYWSNQEGPAIEFAFTAEQAGLHDIWLRFKTTDGNSIYTVYSGGATTRIWHDVVGAGWVWKHVGQMTLAQGARHFVHLRARDHFLSVDKIVVQPAGNPIPTGVGPAQSGFGTVLQPANGPAIEPLLQAIDIRMLLAGSDMRMSHNFMYGAASQMVDDAESETTTSGYSVRLRAANPARRLSLPMNLLLAPDLYKLMQLEALGRPFIVSAYPEEGALWMRDRHTMLACFAGARTYSHDHYHIHSSTLDLLEV